MDILLTNTDFTGKFLIHLDRVDSTNNYCREYLTKTNPKDGAVILADEQFAGRGQAGANWEAEPQKNLTFSIVYHTNFLEAAQQFYLNMAVSLGLAEAVQSCLNPGQKTSIKWPNDIYVNDKKIAGILIENTLQGMYLSWSIIGIGLNVNQNSFSENIRATSLLLENGNETECIDVLKKILQRIEYYFLELKNGNTAELKKSYLEKLYRFNEWHEYAADNEKFPGKINGVNEYGKLIVQTENGEREFGMKEIGFL